jgi:hypothetical protein
MATATLTFAPEDWEAIQHPAWSSAKDLRLAAKIANRVSVGVLLRWHEMAERDKTILRAFAYDILELHAPGPSDKVLHRSFVWWKRLRLALQGDPFAMDAYLREARRLSSLVLSRIEAEQSEFQAQMTEAVEELKEPAGASLDSKDDVSAWLRRVSDQADR